jgi:hypothetical protein
MDVDDDQGNDYDGMKMTTKMTTTTLPGQEREDRWSMKNKELVTNKKNRVSGGFV